MEETKTRQWLHTIGQFGRNQDGSISRVLFSDAYRQAATYLLTEFQTLGLEAWIDAVGNVHGVRRGTNTHAKTRYIGSQLDTVDCGGV